MRLPSHLSLEGVGVSLEKGRVHHLGLHPDLETLFITTAATPILDGLLQRTGELARPALKVFCCAPPEEGSAGIANNSPVVVVRRGGGPAHRATVVQRNVWPVHVFVLR